MHPCMVAGMTISPGQCRAARALIGLRQEDLAEQSGVGLRTIVNFEKGNSTPISANLAAIKRALEDAGVTFLADGASSPGGAGVRLTSD
ncbi:MAG TPA: helix-turn-helix transcriptional regulator [Magnetospirillum sp.]|nr:helix-turn-helix transcriptional regulator [Magnetospirillum sp.]